jgi:hypothetical protein
VDFELIIPRHDGGGLEVSIDVGQTLFVLGANGTGKSALVTLLYGGHQGRARRISAHRQTWMNSNAISLSPEQKRSHEIGMIGIDAQPTARWKDDYSAVRPTIAVYDLIDAENVRARAIAGAVDGDDMPLDNPSARTLLVRGCTVSSDTFISWDADLVPPGAGIDEGLKRDILGARRKLLFVEGETTRSLDTPLYGAVFKDVSVIARGSSRDVEQAMAGVRGAHDLHWLRAFGIVDNDGRSQAEIDQLKGRGIYAVSVFSVESVYYEPEIQRRVAERYAEVTGEHAPARVAAAKAAAIATIVPHVERLSERAVEKSLREEIMRKMPTREQIAAGARVDISVDVAGAVAAESNRLQAFIDAGNLAAIIGRYPVRETGALREIAVNLGFQGREQYERAVRTLLTSDEEARAIVEGLFGTLGADIAAP